MFTYTCERVNIIQIAREREREKEKCRKNNILSGLALPLHVSELLKEASYRHLQGKTS
jgi:hypothetical protein